MGTWRATSDRARVERAIFFLLPYPTMVCPCAAGKGATPVPRLPTALRSLSHHAPLTRNDLRARRTERIFEHVHAKSPDAKTPQKPTTDEFKAEGVPFTIPPSYSRRRPMAGFLRDTMRKR